MNPTSATPEARRAAQRILLATAAVHLVLFCLAAKEYLRAWVAKPTSAQTLGAAVAGIDCHGYYAWLRSPLVDGDWDFDNEFAFSNQYWPCDYHTRTPIGRHANQWSIGPAMVWSVAVIPVHVLLGLCEARGEGSEVGYTPPYQMAVAGITFAMSLVTLVLVYATARCFASPVSSAIAAGGVVLGSTLLAYGTTIPCMAHGLSATALAGFVFAWVRTIGSQRPGRWFGLGLLLGMACLMRWQLATFSVILALEALCTGSQCNARAVYRRVSLLVLAALGTVVAFSPQMLSWFAVYGSPIVYPHATGAGRTHHPELFRVLFSFDRSFFYWTPVTLLAVLAAGYAVVRSERSTVGPIAILLVGAAMQILAIAGLLGPNIFLGSSFGFRFLTETCVVLVPGLAVAIQRAAPRISRGLVGMVCVLAVWNVLVLMGYRTGKITSGGPVRPAELVSGVTATVLIRPLDVVVVVIPILWFSSAVWREFRKSQVASCTFLTTTTQTRRAA